MAEGGYYQDAEDLKRAGSAVKKRLAQYGTTVANAEGGAGVIENPTGSVDPNLHLPTRREQGIGFPTPTGSISARNIKLGLPGMTSGAGMDPGSGYGPPKRVTSSTQGIAKTSIPVRAKDSGVIGESIYNPKSPEEIRSQSIAQAGRNNPEPPSARRWDSIGKASVAEASPVGLPGDTAQTGTSKGGLDTRGDYWRNQSALGSPPQPLGHIATKAKQNMMAKDPRFGPAQRTGGRDVYEMNEGIQGFPEGTFRTGRILESSDWLKDGNAFSSNAWEKTVDGQPNQGYDPNAVQPAGYYNEAGTFIAGPRIKEWEVGTLIAHATAGIKDPELKKSIADGIMKNAGVVPEGTGIGPEKERGLKERMAKIAAEAEKSKAAIAASADMYRSDTPYYQEDRSTPSTPVKQQVVQIGEEPTETGGTKKIWGTPEQAVSGGDRGVSKDRVRVIQNQLRGLKGKDRDDYLDSLSPEEFNAVKGSR